MQDKIIMKESNPFIIEVNGKKYWIKKFGTKIIDHKMHGGETVFVPFDEKKLKADVEFIVDNIEKLIDKKELLKEVFTNMEIDRIEKIRKLVCKKAPVKKTRGCYGITIGDGSSGEYIQLA
jgi:hypothetical protein